MVVKDCILNHRHKNSAATEHGMGQERRDCQNSDLKSILDKCMWQSWATRFYNYLSLRSHRNNINRQKNLYLSMLKAYACPCALCVRVYTQRRFSS